jgi:CBS domain-containing membrane protein
MDMLPPLLARFVPALPKISNREMVRIGIGAFAGIAVAGLLSSLMAPGSLLPFLIPPLGASTVLAFGVPASPLAQPWSVIGGNMVSAVVGVTVAMLVPDPVIAAALAVSLAIIAMIFAKCLHPPGGAVALTAVLGPPAIHAAGYGFVLYPTGLNSLLLVLAALAWNNLTGHRYPHVPPVVKAPDHHTRDPLPSRRTGVLPSDLQAALAQYEEILDVDPEDLEAILHQVQIKAFNRRSGEVTVGAIMSRHVVAVGADTTLSEALAAMTRHDFRILPVVAATGELEGVFTQSDLLRGFSEEPDGDHTAPVARYMTRQVETARENQLIGTLVTAMSDRGIHGMPVVDAENRLTGILTQSDLIAALFTRRVESEPA